VLPEPRSEFFDVVLFARLYLEMENLTIAISKYHKECPQFILDISENKIEKHIIKLYEIFDQVPEVSKIPITRRNDDKAEAFTVYVKKNGRYVIRGLDGGFKGFDYNGLYYVNIRDGATHEECVKYIAHLKDSYYLNGVAGIRRSQNLGYIDEAIRSIKLPISDHGIAETIIWGFFNAALHHDNRKIEDEKKYYAGFAASNGGDF
jgi:hypothetical protein